MPSRSSRKPARPVVSVIFPPSRARVLVPPGTPLLEAARRAGVLLDAPCGGRGVCGKCRVRLAPAGAGGPPTPVELSLLAPEERRRGWRLACQAKVVGDLRVLQAAGTGYAAAKAALGAGRRARRLDPPALAGHAGQGPPSSSGPGRAARPVLGLAVDLGTTSVAVALVDLRDGRVLRLASEANPQAVHGADVISRILYASGGPVALRELQGLAVDCVNRLAGEVLAGAGAGAPDVAEVVVVGNVAMLHLFLGLDPTPLGRAPYAGRLSGPAQATAGDLGLEFAAGTPVYALPVIGGFVGADAVGVLLATGIHRRRNWHLALDLGTNGEVLLARRGRVLACSTAAGPAFEGVGISHGMRATPGAINSLRLLAEPRYTTVGGAPAVGLCGSGLIDLAASLLAAGLLEPGGRLLGRGEARGPLAARLEEVPLPGRPGVTQNAFVVVGDGGGPGHSSSGASSAGGHSRSTEAGDTPLSPADGRIQLTQADVRALQLAKGAVEAASRFLLERAGVLPGELEGVWVAGTFGNCLDSSNAAALGLLPEMEPRRLRFCGNAALEGAKMALLDGRARREAERLASRAEHVDLFAHGRFDDLFLESLRFEPWGWGGGR